MPLTALERGRIRHEIECGDSDDDDQRHGQVRANYGRVIADENFEPAGFALRLGLRDVRLVLAAAEECMSPMPLASMDWSSMTRVLARNAGL